MDKNEMPSKEEIAEVAEIVKSVLPCAAMTPRDVFFGAALFGLCGYMYDSGVHAPGDGEIGAVVDTAMRIARAADARRTAEIAADARQQQTSPRA